MTRSKNNIQTRKLSRTHHTKCFNCGVETDHYNIVPCCTKNYCRQKWYKIINETKTVYKAYGTRNNKDIMNFSLIKLKKFGYKVTLHKIKKG